MGLFQRFNRPIILKTSNYLQEEYEYVKELYNKTNNVKLKNKLKQLEYQVECEKNIIEELSNSLIPMYIIHDVNLDYLGFKRRINYIVITKHKVYVIEASELFGNIKINNKDEFIRIYNDLDHCYEEVIENPIKINDKNLELLKLIGYHNKSMVDKLIFDKVFYQDYQSLIVLGNKNNLLDDFDASYSVRDKVVKIDNLINYIKESDKLHKKKFSNKEMLDIAHNILNSHIEPFICYDLLYKDYLEEKEINKDEDNKIEDNKITDNKIKDKSLNVDKSLEKELRKYRYYLAKKESVSVYTIFSDKTLRELVKNKPFNMETLENVKGFGKKKITKYGDKILGIIKKYCEDNL